MHHLNSETAGLMTSSHNDTSSGVPNHEKIIAERFVPSSTYKKLVVAICKMQDLFTTVHASDSVSPERKERQVFYVLSTDKNSISLYGYIVHPAGTPHAALTEVHPERDFYLKQSFWIGAPQHIFKDYDPVKDKKLGHLAWAAAYDREPINETFCVALADPVLMLTFNRPFIERWMEEAPTKIVDISVTTDDVPKDTPPLGTVPYFGPAATRTTVAR